MRQFSLNRRADRYRLLSALIVAALVLLATRSALPVMAQGGTPAPGRVPVITIQGTAAALISACLPRTTQDVPQCAYPESDPVQISVAAGESLTAVVESSVQPAELMYSIVAADADPAATPAEMTTVNDVATVTIPTDANADPAKVYTLTVIAVWTTGSTDESFYVEYAVDYQIGGVATASSAVTSAATTGATSAATRTAATVQATSAASAVATTVTTQVATQAATALAGTLEATQELTQESTLPSTQQATAISTLSVTDAATQSVGAPAFESGVAESNSFVSPIFTVTADGTTYIPSGARSGDNQVVFSDGARRLTVANGAILSIQSIDSRILDFTVEIANLTNSTEALNSESFKTGDPAQYTVRATPGTYALNITVDYPNAAPITYFYRLNIAG